jgi:hypothetical protein
MPRIADSYASPAATALFARPSLMGSGVVGDSCLFLQFRCRGGSDASGVEVELRTHEGLFGREATKPRTEASSRSHRGGRAFQGRDVPKAALPPAAPAGLPDL